MQVQVGKNPEAPGAATLAESVRMSLIKDLSSGAMRPGQPIDEKLLCDRFQVSRTPIREAILHLAAQGFVVINPRSGATVPKLSLQMLRELLELLGELEGTAASFAARRSRPSERAELQSSVDECMKAAERGDSAAYAAANDRFHELVYDACRNGSLVEQIRALRTRCASYTANRFDFPGRMERSSREHEAVCKAILAMDPQAARDAMLEHISIGGKDFAEFVSGLPPDFVGL
ncbi:MAG: GntR family transcriptional regulator [Variovorax sp.]|nr:GntR family transcriptional regulator [Variovorax sp.]